MHLFVDITKKVCAKFQQKILKSIVVGAHQSFQFFSLKTWFLGNNTGLPQFMYQILYNMISTTKL